MNINKNFVLSIIMKKNIRNLKYFETLAFLPYISHRSEIYGKNGYMATHRERNIYGL